MAIISDCDTAFLEAQNGGISSLPTDYSQTISSKLFTRHSSRAFSLIVLGVQAWNFQSWNFHEIYKISWKLKW
jgi:hypothetical protein